MIIRFERTGGFSAIPLRAEIDTETLEAAERDDLHSLVESADFFNLPELVVGQAGGADRFHYELAIEAGGRSHKVQTGENATGALGTLIERVSYLARSRRK
jgi:hypothetical protein